MAANQVARNFKREHLAHQVKLDAAMNDNRSAIRKRLLKTGFIVISDKAPKIECTIRNISDTGAVLQVSTAIGIPANFDAVLEGARRRCHARWRTDTKIGVQFG